MFYWLEEPKGTLQQSNQLTNNFSWLWVNIKLLKEDGYKCWSLTALIENKLV